MNVWFGTSWGAPICETTPRVPVPVGKPCIWCDEPIAADDRGIGSALLESVGNIIAVSPAYYHVECWIRQTLGSTGHQLKLCPCFGGTYEGEPEGMSKRDAARAAWELARSRAADREG
jgi:hypothetical protein